MNKKECAQILAIVRAVYPNTKIEDAGAMVEGWYMTLGEYPAATIMKAARLHMATSKYFPTPVEITEKIPRAELLYSDHKLIAPKNEPQPQKLLGNNISVVAVDDFLEKVWADD